MKVRVVQGVTVTISGLTFKDSETSYNGFIDNEGTLMLSDSTVSGNKTIDLTGGGENEGGGIYNVGKLTLSNSTVSGNKTTGLTGSYNYGGGIYNTYMLTLSNSMVLGNTATGDNRHSYGGGIVNFGKLTLRDSTVSGNTASSGGGIANFGMLSTLPLINSTVSGNMASSGGGIFISSLSDLSIIPNIPQTILTFSTIYGNTAHDGGDIVIQDTDSNGKPIKQRSQVRISNSIVAADPTHPGPDIRGTLTSGGYNLFQDNSGATFNPASGTRHSTDKTLPVNDLKIDPVLRDNGGSTKPHTLTHALLPGSPASDAIPLQYCQIKAIFNSQSQMYTDQRGVKRPQGPACDIGAYEYTDSST